MGTDARPQEHDRLKAKESETPTIHTDLSSMSDELDVKMI